MTEIPSRRTEAASAAARIASKYMVAGRPIDPAWLVPYMTGIVIGAHAESAGGADLDQALEEATTFVLELEARL